MVVMPIRPPPTMGSIAIAVSTPPSVCRPRKKQQVPGEKGTDRTVQRMKQRKNAYSKRQKRWLALQSTKPEVLGAYWLFTANLWVQR